MNALWKAAGAAAWGAVCFDGLLPFLSEARHAQIEMLCPAPRAVFVAAFPYYAGRAPGNLALYTRGEDYHRVLGRRLEGVCAALRELYPARRFVSGVDASPLPEQETAILAGLGRRGWHNLLIVPPWGSYVFLGTILTDLPLETSCGAVAQRAACTACGACRRVCPTGALSEAGFAPERCLSQLSQKKGELEAWEAEAVRQSPLIWGCDLCQNICPCNRDVPLTPLPAFRENLLYGLSAADLEGLSNRQFRETYGARAFSWRGSAVLRRNLALQAAPIRPNQGV